MLPESRQHDFVPGAGIEKSKRLQTHQIGNKL